MIFHKFQIKYYDSWHGISPVRKSKKQLSTSHSNFGKCKRPSSMNHPNFGKCFRPLSINRPNFGKLKRPLSMSPPNVVKSKRPSYHSVPRFGKLKRQLLQSDSEFGNRVVKTKVTRSELIFRLEFLSSCFYNFEIALEFRVTLFPT